MDTDTRAEDVLPGGYNPTTVTEPPARRVPANTLEYVAQGLAEIRLTADILAGPVQDDDALRRRLMPLISAEAGQLRRLVTALAGGALVLALAVAGAVLAPTPDAQAATTPPAVASASLVDAPVYRVVLDRPVVRLRIPLVTAWPVPGTLGRHCGSVYSAGWRLLGRACSYNRAFTVTVPIDGRVFAPGRTTIWLSDDADPAATFPAVVNVLRPSQVTAVYAADGLAGRMFVAALVQHYNAAAAAWAPSKLSPLYVQVLTRRGWRTRGVITTDVNGYASGDVATGAGTFLVRVVRPVGATVTSAVSAAQVVTVTDTAIDLV